MPIFPYYNQFNRKPYFYNNFRPNYNYYPNYNYNHNSNIQPNTNPELSAPSENNTNTRQAHSQHIDSKDTVWLDLFGIKLYFDDVLILSLLFFLYKEEVKDEGLFLALVLLLIS